MARRIVRKKGFTLIELLIYIGLAGIVIGGVSSLLFIMLTARVKNQTISEVEHQGAYVMKVITQTIRNSKGIDEPQSGTTDFLLLSMDDNALDPTEILLVGTTLTMSEGGNTAIALTSPRVQITNPAFIYLAKQNAPESVHIEFTVSHFNSGGGNAYEYSKTFYGAASVRD